MRNANTIIRRLIVTVACASGCLLMESTTWAHCDTIGGPVVTDARVALQKGDVTPILKWVGREQEAEVRTAFARTVAVRALGPEARELADRYFFETIVRLHRAGEGEPFTGVKDAPADPVIAMADKALTDGSSDELIKKIASHLATVIDTQFKNATEAKNHKDEDVEAGRAFVAAYVRYTHYLEAVHAAIAASDGHAHAASAAPHRLDTAKHDAP
jgi:hypothetical protein